MKSSMLQPCPSWAGRLAARHYDDLSFDDRVALKEHLTSCQVCATVHAAYHTLEMHIRSLPVVEPLPDLPYQLFQRAESSAAHKWSAPLLEAKFPNSSSRPTPNIPGLLQRAITMSMTTLSILASIIHWLRPSARLHAAITYASQRTIYASSGGNYFYALRGHNGSPLWMYKKSDVFFSSPAVKQGVAYLTPFDAQIFLFSLKPLAIKPCADSFLWKH
jgi:hypothetical protein